MRKSQRAQVRMFESIATMFVFFILLVFGFTFYARMQEANMYSKIEERRQLRIVELAEKIKNLPELGCSSNAVLQQDCFDTIKLEKVRAMAQDPDYSEYFYDLITYGSISIEEIYPNAKTYQIYERQKQEESSPRSS